MSNNSMATSTILLFLLAVGGLAAAHGDTIRLPSEGDAPPQPAKPWDCCDNIEISRLMIYPPLYRCNDEVKQCAAACKECVEAPGGRRLPLRRRRRPRLPRLVLDGGPRQAVHAGAGMAGADDEEEAVEVLRQHPAAAAEDPPAVLALRRRAQARPVLRRVQVVPGGAGAIPGAAHLRGRLLGRRPGPLLHAAAMGGLLRQHHLHQVDPSNLQLRRQGGGMRRRVQGLPAGGVVVGAASLRLQGSVHRTARAQVHTMHSELILADMIDVRQ
jgi:hypothetical protein